MTDFDDKMLILYYFLYSSGYGPHGAWANHGKGQHDRHVTNDIQQFVTRHQQDMPQLEPETSEASISEYDSPVAAVSSHYRNIHHRQQQQQQQIMYDESSQNIDDGSHHHSGVIQQMQHPGPPLTPHNSQPPTPLPPALTPQPLHAPMTPQGHMTQAPSHSHMSQSPLTSHGHMSPAPMTPHSHSKMMPRTPQSMGPGPSVSIRCNIVA
ncbi:hypothetical protein ACF0H5_021118 [Mactra antiquata]